MSKGVMPHLRNICKFISIYGTLLDMRACLLHACMNIQYGSRCFGAEDIPGVWLSTNAVLLYSREKTVQYRNTAFCMRNISLPGMLSHNQNISGMDVVLLCCDYIYIKLFNYSVFTLLHHV